MTSPVLEAIKVAKVLGHGAGQVHALRGVDLSLRGGELTLLMGPSGSGKTTLLSVLGCMLAPTSGTVSVCGHGTADAGPEVLAQLRRDHIGFIFQTYHLFPTLTAAENVQLALDVRGEAAAKARPRAEDALARVGLSHKLGSFPREMSAEAPPANREENDGTCLRSGRQGAVDAFPRLLHRLFLARCQAPERRARQDGEVGARGVDADAPLRPLTPRNDVIAAIAASFCGCHPRASWLGPPCLDTT